MIVQTVQLPRHKLDHNFFIRTLLLIKAHLTSQKQRRTLFGLLSPLMVRTNVVCGIMSDIDFSHKEDGGIVLSKMLVPVYQNIQFHTLADTVFINLIFRSQHEYFKGKNSVSLCMILYCR